MATGARSAVNLVVGIGAFALACVAGVAFVGKQIDDAEVSVGHSITPEEIQRRLAERRRVFAAMSPAQHLAAAQRSMSQHYDLAEGNVGCLGEVPEHLAAIPEGSPESAQVGPIRAEIARRNEVLTHFAGDRVLRVGQRLASQSSPGTPESQRHAIASSLDGAPPVGCVHDVGESGTVLRFDSTACNEAFLASVSAEPVRAVLRRVGFRRVQCSAGRAPYGFAL